MPELLEVCSILEVEEELKILKGLTENKYQICHLKKTCNDAVISTPLGLFSFEVHFKPTIRYCTWNGQNFIKFLLF